MSYVFATPEYLAAAATDLSNIGSMISSANAAAVAPTASVLAPGADEVSATQATGNRTAAKTTGISHRRG